MRTIHTDDIIKNIKEMCIAVNVKLSPDVRNAILTARENEESEIGSQILQGRLRLCVGSFVPVTDSFGNGENHVSGKCCALRSQLL